MDIRQIEYFVHVATHRGFNKAAVHLHIAQSALSRHIAQLERELGVALLVRSGRGVQLTSAGEFMLQRAELLLRQFRQTRKEIIAQSDLPQGEIAIGTPPSLQTTLIVPMLTRFHRMHPNVRIRSWVGTSIELREWVLSGRVDFAVYGVLEPEPILQAQPLFRDDLFVIGAPTARFAARETLDVSALAKLPLILTSRPNSLRLLIDNAAARRNVKLNVIIEAGAVSLVMELTRAGVGYTILPYSAIHHLVPAKQVAAIKLKPLSYSWIIGYVKERPLSAAGSRMCALLREIATRCITNGEWPHAKLISSIRSPPG